MPQMSPMDWLLLMFYFMLLYWLVLMMIYFMKNKLIKNYNINKLNKNLYMLKWY